LIKILDVKRKIQKLIARLVLAFQHPLAAFIAP